jgi:hypothetical protein
MCSSRSPFLLDITSQIEQHDGKEYRTNES